ncbi:MAG: peptidoglycan DD-metalloendopeptidase family protein [Hyphomicrobiales bacterium]|nr:peptidoglycan DD-metalloendopeptidase family protein [Hyphomicrobiales bacterium]
MIKRRRRLAERRKVNALVPVFGKKALPQIYLQETKTTRAAVFLSESGDSGAGSRLKWLVSTCLAGVVGVGVIGVTVYASMNVDDSTGVVSAIRSASLAAMQPEQRTKAVKEDQKVAGQKTDRIQTTEGGLATRQIIHETVEKRVAGNDYITIKPYARIIAGLATARPDNRDHIPAFNPFKLYANPTSVADSLNAESADGTAGREVTVNVVEYEGGRLPVEDAIELNTAKVVKLIAVAGETFAEAPFSMRPAILPEGPQDQNLADGQLHRVAYKPEQLATSGPGEGKAPANTTIVEKSWIESDAYVDEVLQNTEVKSVTVKRGDTLMSILTRNGAESWQAKAIYEAMAPVFLAKSLQKGQELRLTLAPAPSDTGQMEPVKVSLFTGSNHDVTVARNGAGEFVASDDPIKLVDAMRKDRFPKRATLYTSVYDAALNQNLSREMITKILRIHSYDVDFKRRVQAGDNFDVFFDLRKDDRGQETEPSELLYTAMTVDNHSRRFFRFRAPDGTVDFYDREGNSAKKFLMRKPVKGSRFTSGFGMRRHPILRRTRMHTGTDWAAPHGTPILAAGTGIVEVAKRKGGNGNYIRIRHANGFKTSYSHMARFARGLRPGIKVSQGQVIGYVGSTGLSSGPHLHFEVLVNNRHVNPMTIHVPRGRQLTGELLTKFHKERSRIEDLMRRSPVTTRVAAATQDAR